MDQLLTTSTLLQQGAEARLHIGSLWFPDERKAVLKHRFTKTYRHAELDRRLTAARTTAEARALQRAAKAGIAVPGVWAVDAPRGVLALEPIAGPTVRAALGAPHAVELASSSLVPPPQNTYDLPTPLSPEDQETLMDLVGEVVAKLHAAHLVHGDLTTSNLLLRGLPRTTDGDAVPLHQRTEVVLIDFGLASATTLAEDKAVDLYVLERAFGSTHPYTPHLFEMLIQSYFVHLTRLLKPTTKPVTSHQAKKEKKDRRQNRLRAAESDPSTPDTPTTDASPAPTPTSSTPVPVPVPAPAPAPEVTKVPAVEEIRRKLEEVRLRGRKRDMTG